MKAFRAKFNLKYLLIAAVLAALLGNSGFRRLVKNYREFSRLSAEKSRLEAQHKELEIQSREIGAKPALEQAARKELSMIRPEETEYRFPPPEEADK
jgi:cell division protein FtsB